MNSNGTWKFLGGLGVVFALPWLVLIVIPFLSMSSTAPVAYVEADEVEGGLTAYPDRSTLRYGASDFGADVYASEGCVYCHTQMVRPTYAGPDMWRQGWGGREADGLARETRPEDYLGEKFAFLGYQRIGPDLSNVGYRVANREEMHQHLRDPKSVIRDGSDNRDSGMPAYKHLYKLDTMTNKLVPTDRAEALVDYLMSRRKDAKIPASLVGK